MIPNQDSESHERKNSHLASTVNLTSEIETADVSSNTVMDKLMETADGQIDLESLDLNHMIYILSV